MDAADPTTSERREEVLRLLAGNTPWPAFLRVGVQAQFEWNGCPETAEEALTWMATGSNGLLDIASAGPLTPVCTAFAALIEAAEDATKAAENLAGLITCCSFLVSVFIVHGKHVGDLAPISKPLDEFVSTMNDLAKHAKGLASRNKDSLLLRHREDAKTITSFEDRLRRICADVQGISVADTPMTLNRLEQTLLSHPAPVMAQIPAAALPLSSSHVERADLVSEVVSHLTDTDVAGPPYVLTGIGGGGKTVLASSVVRTKEIREHFRQGISWVTVGRGGVDQLQALFEGIAKEMDVASTIQRRCNSVDEVVRHLTLVVSEGTGPRLIVLDDVWEREVVDTLQATGLQLLVTTRRRSVVAVAGGRTDVGNMDRGEARELLKKKSGAAELPETQADQVAEACGWHALTLAIAGSLRSVTDSPNSALAWQKLRSEIVRKKAMRRGPEMNTDSNDNPSKTSLYPVLNTSLEALGRDEQMMLLSLVVLPRGGLAPVPMLANIWQKDDRGARKEADLLVDNSLLQEVDGSYRLHDLLLDFITTICQGEDAFVDKAVGRQAEFLGRVGVLRGYSDKGESLEGFYSLIGLWRKLVELCGDNHLDVNAYNTSLEQLEDESEIAAGIFWAVGRLFELQGKYANVKPLYERSLAIREKVLGPDHPDVASSLNGLAVLLKTQGYYDDAKPLYERSLAIREKVLGHDHPDVASSLNGLAALLKTQGYYEDAKPLYERSLAIREKVLGPDHPDVASSLNSLAVLLKTQGYYDDARPLYERSLAIREKVLGPDHPDVATSLNSLAVLLKTQGYYDDAKPLYERSLAICEKVLGPDHPDVASSLNNLAVLLKTQGYCEDAKPLYERSLVIREKVLGPDHPDVATSLNSLAVLLKTLGNLEDAKPLYERSLAIREKVLGPDHPDVASSLNGLAALLASQGYCEDAKPLYERSLVIREKVLGPDHPDVATSLNSLAALLASQGNPDVAKPLYERSLAIREKVLGLDHPDVASSLNNLAVLLESQGYCEDAKPLYERSLAILEKKLGPDHPDVAASLNNLAVLAQSQGNPEDAKPLYERSLAVREKVLGADHPDVASSLNNLAMLLASLGYYDDAKPLYERSLVIREKVLGPEHPDVASSLNGLAALLKTLDNPGDAKPLYERSLAIREKMLGPDHPDVASSLNSLAALLGYYEDAKPLHERSLTIRASREKVLDPDHSDVASSITNLAGFLASQAIVEGVSKDEAALEGALRDEPAFEDGEALTLDDMTGASDLHKASSSLSHTMDELETDPGSDPPKTDNRGLLSRHYCQNDEGLERMMTQGKDTSSRQAIRQVWLPSCGNVNAGALTPDGAALSLHSVTRRALCPSGDGPARVLHLPPGGIPGCGVICQRWRDTYGQVEIKTAAQDRKHLEYVRLLDDVFMVQVSRRQESGACLIMPVVHGPAGTSFSPGTASISYYVGRYDLLVLTKGEKGGKKGMESYVRETYFAVEQADGANQPWKEDSTSTVVWKGEEVWLEVELQHFSRKGLAEKWDRFKRNVSGRGPAPTSGTGTPSSTTSSAQSQEAGPRGSRTPLGSSRYPEIQVFNDTEECLRVMLVPETFLTAEAHARSQAAGLSLQIAGHGLSVDGSRETSDSLSQQPTFVYSSLTWVTIPKGETIDLELPGGKRCRILWCSISDRFKPEDLPIDQDTKNPVDEDELSSHGYETVATGRWPYKTYHFKEIDRPEKIHRSLLFVRVWEQSSISGQRRNEPRTMRRSVMAESCVWNTAVPSLPDINRKIVSWLVTIVPGAGAPFS